MTSINYPRIDIIFGSMFSGKSTLLLNEAIKFSKAGFKVLFANSKYDTRDVANVFSTHNPGIKKHENENLKFIYVTKLAETLEYKFDILIVDEAQFMLDIVDTVLLLVNKFKKRVLIGALDGDSNQDCFGLVYRLIPWCDNIVKLKAFCKECSEKGKLTDACFTYRKNEENDKNVICIGASDKYSALCRDCLLLNR